MLEIGAGKESYKRYFPQLDVISTDKEAIPGIDETADVTKLKYADNTFDYILCVNVLEHLIEPEKAVKEIRRVLKVNGKAFAAVPFLFPIHDPPHDYWRFTEFSLRKIFNEFSNVLIKPVGIKLGLLRRFALLYFIEAVK
jgi:ubiquinone/menaquinone biosynthesis C-methylase UbiE